MARKPASKKREEQEAIPLLTASVDEDYSKTTGEVSPEDLIAAAIRAGIFVYDIETNNSLNPREGRIECVTFYVPAIKEQESFGEVRALYPFVENTMIWARGSEVTSLRDAMPQAETMERLRPIFLLPNVIKLSANGKFDNAWFLIAPGTDTPVIVAEPQADSMLADYVSDERRRRYGLKGRIEEEFKVKMTKYNEASQRQGQFSFMKSKPLGVYSMEDCYWTYRLHEKALESIRQQDPTGRLEKIYWGIEVKLRQIILEMETTGCLVDYEHLIGLERRLENSKAEILAKIIKSAGWAPNLRSPSQVSDFLFNSPEDGGLGLPTEGLEQNADGAYSTAERVIKHFGRKNELVRLLLDYRSLEVIDRSFCKKLIHISQTEGRVFTGFSQVGTVTGRLSCVDGNTVLRTNKGSIKISELDILESYTILTHEARHRRIVGKIYKGTEEMYEVTLENGSKITCTKAHQLLTNNGWKALGDLSEGDLVISNTVTPDHIRLNKVVDVSGEIK